ncbi:unnamed protein product [Arabis nemorensis]|uniref:Uncharacterized protein n=1 Tax=Arabis nemorensis TaxID=586526 RepID=A0A565B0B0_9BRAS|nr:unnamed protein product [Arabis nemorensis]
MTRADPDTLCISEIYPTTLSVKMTDSSSPKIIGIVYNLNIQIGNTFIPTDFLVMESTSRDSTLLGRPFLVTTGAVFDMPKKRMVLTNVNKKKPYYAEWSLKCKGYPKCDCLNATTLSEARKKRKREEK